MYVIVNKRLLVTYIHIVITAIVMIRTIMLVSYCPASILLLYYGHTVSYTAIQLVVRPISITAYYGLYTGYGRITPIIFFFFFDPEGHPYKFLEFAPEVDR